MNISVFERTVLRGLLLLFLLPLSAFAQPRYQVAACDWMMLKRQKLGEFQLAKDIGADGVEVDMGPLGTRVLFDNKLRDPAERDKFVAMARKVGVQVPSMAMSGFFAQNLLKRDNYRDLIQDCLESMKFLGAKVAFLPLGGSGHEWENPQNPEYKAMTSRLHDIGEMARQQGMVVGIRTQMGADFDIKFLKAINSKGIKVYYNLQDAVDQHRDVNAELKKLGRKRVCQIHASLTDSVTLDRDPRIDLRQVRRTLDKMKWNGWLVVERSRDAKDVRNVKGNFGTNVRYLKEIFQQ